MQVGSVPDMWHGLSYPSSGEPKSCFVACGQSPQDVLVKGPDAPFVVGILILRPRFGQCSRGPAAAVEWTFWVVAQPDGPADVDGGSGSVLLLDCYALGTSVASNFLALIRTA